MVIAIIAGIAALLVIIAGTLIIIDRVTFTKKITNSNIGDTGKEIQNSTKLKVEQIEVISGGYTGKVYSKTRLFKYQFTFENGKLVEKKMI